MENKPVPCSACLKKLGLHLTTLAGTILQNPCSVVLWGSWSPTEAKGCTEPWSLLLTTWPLGSLASPGHPQDIQSSWCLFLFVWKTTQKFLQAKCLQDLCWTFCFVYIYDLFPKLASESCPFSYYREWQNLHVPLPSPLKGEATPPHHNLLYTHWIITFSGHLLSEDLSF